MLPRRLKSYKKTNGIVPKKGSLSLLIPRISMPYIFDEREQEFLDEAGFTRDLKMNLCRQHAGEKLKARPGCFSPVVSLPVILLFIYSFTDRRPLSPVRFHKIYPSAL